MFCFKVSLFLYVILTVVGKYFIQADNEKLYTDTWVVSKDVCVLATPLYKHVLGELKINLTVDLPEEHWVGYFKASTGFEYIACIPDTKFKKSIKLSLPLTLGQCYSACDRKEIFGISSKTCYCLDEKEYDKSHKYSSPLDCVSIYKVNKNVTKTYTYYACEKMCMTFQTQPDENASTKLFKWKDCGQSFKQHCYNDVESSPEESHNWETCAKRCFNKSSHSLSYNELKRTSIMFPGPIWTSITCSDVIYECKDYDSTLPNIRFGYVTRKNNGVVLKFKSDSVKYKALCTKDQREVSEVSTSASVRFSSTRHSLRKNTETSEQTPVKDMGESATILQVSSNRTGVELYQERNTNDDDVDSAVFVIVGASVGAVVVVGIVVVAVGVVLKKRKSATSKSSETEHVVVFSNEISGDIPKPPTYDDVDPKPNDEACYSQTYHIDKNEPCIKDDVYDTTQVSSKGKQSTNENIYNKLGTDEIYDKSGQEKSTINNESINMYSKLDEDIQTVYNITRVKKEPSTESGNIYDKMA